jgi:hypothetical protein
MIIHFGAIEKSVSFPEGSGIDKIQAKFYLKTREKEEGLDCLCVRPDSDPVVYA